MRRGAIVLVASALIGARAEAQQASCLDSIPASAFQPTVVLLSRLFPDAVRGTRDVASPGVDAFTQEVGQRVRRALGGISDSLPSAESALGWRDIGPRVRVVATRDGRFSWRAQPEPVDLGVTNGTKGVSLIGRALDALAMEGTRLRWADALAGDSISFDLRFGSTLWREDGSGTSVPSSGDAPVFTLRMPSLEPVRPLRVTAPRYPDDLRRAGYEAELLVKFVVNADGSADEESLRGVAPAPGEAPEGFAENGYPRFLEQVRRSLRQWRFEPSRIGGCAVPQLVQQPLTFRLAHRRN